MASSMYDIYVDLVTHRNENAKGKIFINELIHYYVGIR
jgi:hypothetical protein